VNGFTSAVDKDKLVSLQQRAEVALKSLGKAKPQPIIYKKLVLTPRDFIFRYRLNLKLIVFTVFSFFVINFISFIKIINMDIPDAYVTMQSGKIIEIKPIAVK